MRPDIFPAYTDFDPLVPIRCATPNSPGCIHRFFDTSPFSPSGRYLAVFQFPFEDRQPAPGDEGTIRVVDLETGEDREVAKTRGWEPQMGANVNWGGSDRELYFNDVDTKNWTPFAWKCDPVSGSMRRMEGTVYHASPDGKYLISADMTTMRRTQPGYGVRIPDELVRRDIGASADNGFYLTDTATGKRRLFASIKDLLDGADPAVGIDRPEDFEIYGFHSKFNPQGDRLMLSLRWFPKRESSTFDMFKVDHAAVRFAWVTVPLNGGPMACAVGPEEWVKGGHHATWFPDGKRISMNLNIDRDGLRFVQVNADGSGLRKMFPSLLGSGHPTVHLDGKHLLTDSYTNEKVAFGDGTTPLRWIDLPSGAERALARIPTATGNTDSPMRLDPHPAWDRSWRYFAFNAFQGGTRRVFIADMKDLIG